MSRKTKEEADLEVEIARSVIQGLPDDKLLASLEFLNKLKEFKRISKLYDTYITGVETALRNTKNGRMYVSYKIDGTVTGRLSNSGENVLEGRPDDGKIGVSFHTLPREQGEFNIRDYVIAPPGHKFITIDMKAMELRVLAHVANEKNMIKAFESGIDLHDYTTEMVFGKKKSEVSEKQWKLDRQDSKEASFLTVYGGTENTLAAKRGITVARAKKVIDNWMAAYPGVPAYMEYVREYITANKFIKTIFGRKRNLPNIASPFKGVRNEAFRQGLNFTVQSPASDILCCGFIGTYNEFKKKKMNAKLAATVHDSLEIICPDDEVDEVIRIAYHQLVNYPYMREKFNLQLKVPLEIEVEVGTSFGNGKKVDLTSYSLLNH